MAQGPRANDVEPRPVGRDPDGGGLRCDLQRGGDVPLPKHTKLSLGLPLLGARSAVAQDQDLPSLVVGDEPARRRAGLEVGLVVPGLHRVHLDPSGHVLLRLPVGLSLLQEVEEFPVGGEGELGRAAFHDACRHDLPRADVDELQAGGDGGLLLRQHPGREGDEGLLVRREQGRSRQAVELEARHDTGTGEVDEGRLRPDRRRVLRCLPSQVDDRGPTVGKRQHRLEAPIERHAPRDVPGLDVDVHDLGRQRLLGLLRPVARAEDRGSLGVQDEGARIARMGGCGHQEQGESDATESTTNSSIHHVTSASFPMGRSRVSRRVWRRARAPSTPSTTIGLVLEP